LEEKEKEIKDKSKTINELSNILITTKSDLEKYACLSSKLNTQIRDNELMIADKNNKICLLSDKLIKENDKLTKLYQDLEHKNECFDTLSTEFSALKNNRDSLIDMVKIKTDKIEDLEKQIKNMYKTSFNEKISHEFTLSTIQSLEKSNNTLQSENISLHQKIQELETKKETVNEFFKLKKELTDMQNENIKLTEIIKNNKIVHDEEYDKLKKELTSMQNENTILTEIIKNNKIVHDEEYDKLKKEAEQNNVKKLVLEMEIHDLRKNISILKNNLGKIENIYITEIANLKKNYKNVFINGCFKCK
jgi:chromosome segregation ATPase